MSISGVAGNDLLKALRKDLGDSPWPGAHVVGWLPLVALGGAIVKYTML
jgi:hypothetical protein